MFKSYIGTKIINAKPMTRGEYNQFRGWDLPSDEDANDPGYLVQYSDTYVSWSPQDVFDQAYREVSLQERELLDMSNLSEG